LQEKRVSLNIGLEEVSEATGISTGVLKTLESDDREHFPAELYVKAFYKKYADFLELDPEEVLSAYQQKSQRRGKSRGRYSFGTVVTLKGQEESLFVEIARKFLVPIVVVLGAVSLYWIYSNYLSSYNPIDYFK
jgi:cytoskeletal protein RodZ